MRDSPPPVLEKGFTRTRTSDLYLITEQDAVCPFHGADPLAGQPNERSDVELIMNSEPGQVYLDQHSNKLWVVITLLILPEILDGDALDLTKRCHAA